MLKARRINLLLLFLLIPSVSMPMHKIGPLLKTASIVGAGLLGGVLLRNLLHYMQKPYQDAPENVKNWLIKEGLSKDSSIQIKMVENNKLGSASPAFYIPKDNFIVLTSFKPFAVHQEQNQFGVILKITWKDELSASDIANADFIEIDLPTALSYHEQLTQMDDGYVKKQALDKIGKKINFYKAVIQHEEAHAQQFKFFPHKYIDYIIPFLTGIPFMLSFTRFIEPRLNKNLAGRLIALPLVFVGSRISNCCLKYPWIHYLERKADYAIENDRSVLLAFKKWLENRQNTYIIRAAGRDLTKDLFSGFMKKEKTIFISNFNSKLNTFLLAIGDLEHPTIDTRIKRINQRLARMSENAAK